MKISEFSKYLQKLEDTSKRLEIISILTDLIKNLSEEDVDKALYLSQGSLKADFENPKFNIAEKMMVRVLENAYNVDKQEINKLYGKLGDLGSVALEIASKDSTEKPAKETAKRALELEITDVYTKLIELAEIEGAGSQEAKVSKLSALLRTLDNLSAKFVVRIVLGTTRLGFTELTIIDALSNLLQGDKGLREEIEMKYNVHPDLGLIAKKLKTQGIKGVKDIKIEIGVPIWPQKCQRLSSPEEVIEKMQNVWAEFKFDGTRVQLHLDRKKRVKSKKDNQKTLFDSNESTKRQKIFIKTFTRNLEDTTHQYPDISKAAEKQINAQSVILDGEAIGYNKETGAFLPFQEIMQRKRKHNVAEIAKEIPLKYFVFDILYLNGKSLLNKTLAQRKELLKKIIKEGNVIELSKHVEANTVDQVTEFFEEAKEKALEGLILKKPESMYQAGARAFTWVKLKTADEKLLALEDTIDCVILGWFYGKGVRADFGIGKFLVGIYDKKSDSFKTFTKVGTGLTDEEWTTLRSRLQKLKVKEKPANVDVNKFYTPDVWVVPKIVVELGGDEISKSETHTSGYALRFPRLVKFRPDKKPSDVTSLEEITHLHKSQKRGYYS